MMMMMMMMMMMVVVACLLSEHLFPVCFCRRRGGGCGQSARSAAAGSVGCLS